MGVRQDIDLFLIELDKFIEKNWVDKNYEDILFLFRWNPASDALWKKNDLSLPFLEQILNEQSIKAKKTQEVHTQTRRKSWYIKRVAYWLDWIYVKEAGYEHFFKKAIFKRDNLLNIPAPIQEWEDFFLSHNVETIYVPKKLFQDFNLYKFDL